MKKSEVKKFYPVNYRLNEKLLINGSEIQIQVIESPYQDENSENGAEEIEDFLFMIPGGPGFSGIKASKEDAKALHSKAKEKNLKLPHLILFDPLGCGKSDEADVSQYNVMNYTEMNAAMLEAIKEKLNLKKMNVHIYGRSFGNIPGNLLPLVRPAWVNDLDSAIKIKQIIGSVGANGAGMKPYTVEFLTKKFADQPHKLAKFLAAQDKLYSGDFKDLNDFVRNFVLIMAELYAEDGKEIAESIAGKLANFWPRGALGLLNVQNFITELFGFENFKLSMVIQSMGECKLPVINHFFANDFDGIKVDQKIRSNKTLYTAIPKTYVTSEGDHVVGPETSHQIQAELPESTCAITLKGPHMNDGPAKDLLMDILLDLATTGSLNVRAIEDSEMVAKASFSKEYLQSLKTIYPGRNHKVKRVTFGSVSRITNDLQIKPDANTFAASKKAKKEVKDVIILPSTDNLADYSAEVAASTQIKTATPQFK